MQTNHRKSVCFAATSPFAVNSFLLRHMSALADEMHVALCVNLKTYDIDKNIDPRIVVHDVNIIRKISPAMDLVALWQMISIFRRNHFDIVHSITPKGGLLAMLAAAICNVPRRYHTFTGQVWATRKGLARGVLKALDRLISLLASQVFSDSASQCALLCSEGVVREGRIGILGEGSIAGVDLERFHPDAAGRDLLRRQLGTDSSVCVFLFVGRLAVDKGVFDLMQAFQEVFRELPTVELWMVGPDDDGVLPKLQEVASGYAIPVRWLGATTAPEHFMASADVLVLPSYREGFGSVIIEAAACGIPSVAYRIVGVIDAVVDGHTGLLVEPRQPAALAGAMRVMASDSKLRHQLAAEAWRRAVESFSSKAVTAAWLDYYRIQLG